MKDGDVKEFVESLHYEDRTVFYNDRNYFFNGCSYHLNNIGSTIFTFEIYILDDDGNGETIYSVQCPTAEECIEKFLLARLFNGKTFYEVEKDMTEIDL